MSPKYDPVIVCVPVPTALGVYVTEQVADEPLPLNVHPPLEPNAPLPLLANVTVPVGALLVPESVSVVVTVQVAAESTLSGSGVQLTEVEVVRLLTVNV